MSNTKLTNYDRATIVDWYDKGMYSQRELGEIYGVSRSTIRRVIEDDRNFCGRADRPTFSYVGQPSDWEMGLSDDTPATDGPQDEPMWLGLLLAATALACAGFVGWLMYGLYNG